VQSAERSFAVEVVAAVVITRAQLQGETIVLTWNAIPDQTYRVQYKDKVTDAEWTDLTDVSAAESTATVVASLLDEFGRIPSRFFRIMIVN